ncbi:MAG: bifunctional enoyl-CoA hydratase/phosphate acetyltransferase [Calditrichaceae bacterium]|nr:bifunctional enoyl-CoA hydratase/phosphate acetyltransferase [Calditrichaceae bacterium]
MLKNFNELLNRLNTQKKKKIVVAMAEDSDVLLSLEKARSGGLAEAALIGSRKLLDMIAIAKNLDLSNYDIINNEDEKSCITEAVQMVNRGEAQVLMKGLCSTKLFLKGILDKESGLRMSPVLSHLAIFESPNYRKLLMMSDAAMNIAPDLDEKIAITNNAVTAALSLGYKQPKVAILSAVEKVNAAGMPSSADAAIIAKMAERGQIKNAIIDGPLAVDNALSEHANAVKNLISPVGGDADICIVPNIESGNIFYKLLTVLGNAQVAGIVLGAKTPIVLTSRADSDQSKFLSIAAALTIS